MTKKFDIGDGERVGGDKAGRDVKKGMPAWGVVIIVFLVVAGMGLTAMFAIQGARSTGLSVRETPKPAPVSATQPPGTPTKSVLTTGLPLVTTTTIRPGTTTTSTAAIRQGSTPSPAPTGGAAPSSTTLKPMTSATSPIPPVTPTTPNTLTPAPSTGSVPNDIPGIVLALGSGRSSVVDKNTKPREVWALNLVAGQTVQFTITGFYLDGTSRRGRVILANPGSKSFETGTYSEAFSAEASAFFAPSWKRNFTPAVSGTYYLAVLAEGSGLGYTISVIPV